MDCLPCRICARAHPAPITTHNTQHTKTNDITPTMASAAASYDNLPMELWPRYHINREEIVPTSQWYHRFIFAAAGSPSAAHLRHCTKIAWCRPPWPSPTPVSPHMNTFPWSYGPDVISIESKSSLILNDTIGTFLQPLDLRRRLTYATSLDFGCQRHDIIIHLL